MELENGGRGSHILPRKSLLGTWKCAAVLGEAVNRGEVLVGMTVIKEKLFIFSLNYPLSSD